MPAHRPPSPRSAASAPPASAVQLEYAWSPERSRLVHISEVQSGENYQHPDPALRFPLVPRRGFLRRHHFAHHPTAGRDLALAGTAARASAGGEGWRHLNFKLALVHALQSGDDLALRGHCPVCSRVLHLKLRQLVAFDAATWELPFGAFRLDVGLRRAAQTVGALEVFDTHAVDAAKRAAFAAAAVKAAEFQALELRAAVTPLQPPLELLEAVPRLLCAPCQERRQAWLTWSAAHRPATNFSGWIERPAAPETLVTLGGGWATRVAQRRDTDHPGADALTPVFHWLELRIQREREVLISALTMHRQRGCLRFRELRLRLPSGVPSTELAFQLTHVAQEFAAGAQRFHQRLARAEPAQLERWLAAAAQASLPDAPPTAAATAAPTIAVATGDPAGDAAAAAAAAPDPLKPPLPSPSPPASRRLARWIDRLAHHAADWLEEPRA